jgi:hypothetical protein
LDGSVQSIFMQDTLLSAHSSLRTLYKRLQGDKLMAISRAKRRVDSCAICSCYDSVAKHELIAKKQVVVGPLLFIIIRIQF